MNTPSPRLIGPAGKLADLFARTLGDASTVKLLLTGQPGVGKTALANAVSATLTGNPWAVESVNGRKCSLHVVAEWQRLVATSCMFGTGWRAFVVNEVDTCPADAQDLLLTFLDEMPANCALIATSNLELDKLTPRFISRLARHAGKPRTADGYSQAARALRQEMKSDYGRTAVGPGAFSTIERPAVSPALDR